VIVPPLTWLYVPGDRPDRVEKAIGSAAHAVIVDLEDGVAPESKEAARRNVRELLGRRREKPIYVRINSLRTTTGEADLAALRGLEGIDGVHIPKLERPEEVEAALELLAEPRPIHGLIETAVGVEAAYDIARSGVAAISLGESDLRSETGALEAGLDWARSRIVNAAVAAGLPRPPQSVYPYLKDDEGLARSCVRGRELGHLGRSAIHPSQLPIIEQAYLPTNDEVARARATVERVEHVRGAATLTGGEFVDAAMLGAARQIIAVAARFGTAASSP
jgi:citrate lyase subunit beta/citryl-CoA lyase